MVTVVVQNVEDLKKKNDAVRSKKERVAPDPLIISDCEAAAEIAAKLIPKHHHELAGANIVYLCRNKAAKSAGKLVPGQVKKASPTDAHISRAYFNKSDMSGEDSQEAHFIMTIALEVWNNLQPNQRTALIDHLLTRCVGVEDEKSGEMKYGIRPPQIQEFAEVAERHGRWNDDLSELGDCLKGK